MPTPSSHRSACRRTLVAALLAGAAWASWGQSADADRSVQLRTEALALEHGEGTAPDALRAGALYCEAARLGDADAQFNLGWMYANGRGVPRDDRHAAFFFAAAAEQGIVQATRLLDRVGGAGNAEAPVCMQPPPVAIAAPAPAAPPVRMLPARAPRALVELVQKIAPEYAVEPHLVLAIMAAESNFDPAALSPRNAMGLMQLIPDTAARFRVRNPYDPAQSIRGGTAYLRWLLALFQGDVSLVAAAYNAGERTVERYRGVPPYAETRAYVRRIVQAMGDAPLPFDPSVTAPSELLRAARTARVD